MMAVNAFFWKARLSACAIDRLLGAAVKEPQRLVYLPLVGRKTFWTVFLDPQTAEPMAFMPLDPF